MKEALPQMDLKAKVNAYEPGFGLILKLLQVNCWDKFTRGYFKPLLVFDRDLIHVELAAEYEAVDVWLLPLGLFLSLLGVLLSVEDPEVEMVADDKEEFLVKFEQLGHLSSVHVDGVDLLEPIFASVLDLEIMSEYEHFKPIGTTRNSDISIGQEDHRLNLEGHLLALLDLPSESSYIIIVVVDNRIVLETYKGSVRLFFTLCHSNFQLTLYFTY